MLNHLHNLVREALSSIDGTNPELLEITVATHQRFGDFQTNVALQHAKILKRNPFQIAEEISERIPSNTVLKSIDIQKPGFINFQIADSYLESCLKEVLDGEEPRLPQEPDNPTILFDYSSPNVAKTMHVAHLRSTIQGDSLKRIYKALGWQVIADNHIGDWGTQFGKLLYAFKNFPKSSEGLNISFLEKIYQDFVSKAEVEPALEERAREELASLQRKEEPNFSLWQEFLRISLAEFEGLYKRLGVHFDTQLGESFFHNQLQEIVDHLKDKGLARESEGAQVIFFEDEKLPPFLVQKKDGSFLYSTTDIAAIMYRVKTYAPKSIVYVTDSRQKLHFEQLFSVSEVLGLPVNLVHVPFGLMKFSEGTVMSTRKGAVISLEEFLNEAQRRAYEVVKDTNYEEAEKLAIARKVGLGAVKYQDLSQNPSSDILFTWDKALSLEGNSAPYLQYAYARVCGIQRKYCAELEVPTEIDFNLQHPSERDLALFFFSYASAVSQAASTFKPNIVADYLFTLSQKFASFYNQCPVIKEPDPGLRLSRYFLCQNTARILKHGLDLLGIEVMDRM
mgnify:CR=1 FL=1